MQQLKQESYTLPAPVNGWNTIDPIDLMKDGDAITLVNMFPSAGRVKMRSGYAEHSKSMGGGAVPTLIDFTTKAGVKKLIAGANNRIYDCTTSGVAATSLKNSGITENYWQSIAFKNTLLMFNGTDQPIQYDGSTVTDATYTGITDDAKLITPSMFKGRLYLVEKNTTSVWYGSAGAVTGALTEYDIGQFLQKGGSLLFGGSLTDDTGPVLQDLFVLVSNQGEVLIYTGDYPGGTEWTISAHFFISPPLGHRAFLHYKQDLHLICRDGIYSLSSLLQNNPKKLNEKINPTWIENVSLYSANKGWEMCVYPDALMGIVNIPLASNTSFEQHVFNIDTGAWCRFTGLNAITWRYFDGKLYFGGTDGKVYLFDSGTSDGGNQIEIECKYAFSYFKDRTRKKRFLKARPLFVGNQKIDIAMDIDVDYEDRQIENIVSVLGSPGASWDSAVWDVDPWDSLLYPTSDWYSLSGMGRCGAVKLAGNYANVELELSAVNVIYESGGVL